jgi:hypothetical protein
VLLPALVEPEAPAAPVPAPAPAPATVPAPVRVLVPLGRFDWERVVRDWPMTKPMTQKVKLVALVAATYADRDGTRVRPGEHRLADSCGMGGSTARRFLAVVIELGLLEQVRRGGNGMATEYRLTAPAADLPTDITAQPR